MTRAQGASHRREVLALAIPTFATLVSEPLLLMGDAAIIGHLGTVELAGLGIAGNIITVIAGLCVFLAYGTTATVARRLGAGDRTGALAGGVDGIVLAGLIGVLVTAFLQLSQGQLIALYQPSAEVAQQANSYLRVASLGFPFLLVMLAATGVLRGLQDTRTPLKVAITLNLSNIALNLLLVHGLHLGIAGSAIGTVCAQVLAAAILAWVVIRGARREGTPLRFRPLGVLDAARNGGWLVLRTLGLQVSITATTVVATHTGAVGLASHQVVNSVWTFLAFALDAVAIAAQAVIGKHLGAGDAATTRHLTAMMVRWGVLGGIVSGSVIAAVSWVLPLVFTPDPEVRSLVTRVLLVVALQQPLAGVVFVLDGVLIGAGDARYLAIGGLLVAAAYLPLALLVDRLAAGLIWLWAAYGISMVGRLIVLGVRARGERWMRLGV